MLFFFFNTHHPVTKSTKRAEILVTQLACFSSKTAFRSSCSLSSVKPFFAPSVYTVQPHSKSGFFFLKKFWSPSVFWSVNLCYFNYLFYNATIQNATANGAIVRNDGVGEGKAEGFSQMALLHCQSF